MFFQHTGGIIWETSYLLLEYLLLQCNNNKPGRKLGRVLEVGAGCGLLGLGLAAASCLDSIVLTEVEPVINNLQQNLEQNVPSIPNKQLIHHSSATSTHISSVGAPALDRMCCCCQLDWNDFEKDALVSNGILQRHSYDTVIGTDVLFAPSLVAPLLETLQWATHTNSIIHICVQIRCSVSHELFQTQACNYNLTIENISDQIYKDYPTIEWGRQLECIIFRLTRSK